MSLITGIDIGSGYIHLVAGETTGKTFKPKVLVKKPSEGVRHGYIINSNDLSRAIRSAIDEAEKSLDKPIHSAVVSVGGASLGTETVSNTVAIARADGEITDLDISRIISECETQVLEDPNSKIIHTIPYEFIVDGQKVIGKPQGIRGGRFEAKTLFITTANNHFHKLIKAVENAGIEVEDVFAAPIAESIVTVSNVQKNAGCVLANIGAEAVTALVYEEGLPRSLATFKIGCSDITNDIALGLKIPLNEASDIQHGMSVSHLPRGTQRKISDIIAARLSDIFELVDKHLKDLGRNSLLPAGIILTGGCTHLEGIIDVAKDSMKLPASIAENSTSRITPQQKTNGSESPETQKQMFKDRQMIDSLQHAEWSVAYGLCVLGMDMDNEESTVSRVTKNAKHKLMRFIQQFLP